MWYINQKDRLIDNDIQFYMYLDALWLIAEKVPCLYEEETMKYRRVTRFVIYPHAIHIQAQRDQKKQWLKTQYKLSDDQQLDMLVDDWPTEWTMSVSIEELLDTEVGPPPDALVD